MIFWKSGHFLWGFRCKAAPLVVQASPTCSTQFHWSVAMESWSLTFATFPQPIYCIKIYARFIDEFPGFALHITVFLLFLRFFLISWDFLKVWQRSFDSDWRLYVRSAPLIIQVSPTCSMQFHWSVPTWSWICSLPNVPPIYLLH